MKEGEEEVVVKPDADKNNRFRFEPALVKRIVTSPIHRLSVRWVENMNA